MKLRCAKTAQREQKSGLKLRWFFFKFGNTAFRTARSASILTLKRLVHHSAQIEERACENHGDKKGLNHGFKFMNSNR